MALSASAEELEDGVLLGRHARRRVQVTFWITVSSPEPVDCTSRFQPAAGTNESIEKPSGTVSTTFVVFAFSFSVGTASVKSCPLFASATGGLRWACANAEPAAAAASAAAAVTARGKRSLTSAPFT